MSVTESIQEILQGIDDAQYGRDMRQFIHKGIQKCYEEGSAGETDLVARDSIDKILEIFGDVETGSTASKDYSIGDSLIYDGRLYKAKTAITEGDTLTVGTNIEETRAVSSISDIYEIPYSKQSTYSDSVLYIIPSIKLMVWHIKGTASNTYPGGIIGQALPIPIGLHKTFFYSTTVSTPVFLSPTDSQSTNSGFAGSVTLLAGKGTEDANYAILGTNLPVTEQMSVEGLMVTPYWRLNSNHPFSEAIPVELDF